MGSDDRHNERPVRTVTVGEFEIFRFELTFREYAEFARETNRVIPPDPMGWGRESRPVIHVSWNDAILYANWLSRRDRLTPAYEVRADGVVWNRTADGWRLPTEAEWEFAARGGLAAEETRHAGSSDIDDVAWFGGNSGGTTHPVGTKQPNELGLHDMSGNVAEWVWDRYALYPDRDENDPAGPETGDSRVVRGGSWLGTDESPRVTYRLGVRPDHRAGNIGFRLLRTITIAPESEEPEPTPQPEPEPDATPEPDPLRDTPADAPAVDPTDAVTGVADTVDSRVVRLAAGTFPMGSVDGEFDERPVSRVRLDAFEVSRTAVSRAEFAAFTASTGHSSARVETPATDEPVGNVTWFDAIAYANWLSRNDGLTPAYTTTRTAVTWDRDANGWRLPTEAEWEYAARAVAGSGVDARGEALSSVVPSGRWEWVWDYYDYYPATDRANPSGPEHGFFRVLRGGTRPDGTMTPSARSMSPPSFRGESYGFRLVRSVR